MPTTQDQFFARHKVSEGLLKGKVISEVTFNLGRSVSYCSGLHWDKGQDALLAAYFQKKHPNPLDPKQRPLTIPADLKSFLNGALGEAPSGYQAFDLQLVARLQPIVVCALDAMYKYDPSNPNQSRLDARHQPRIKRFYGVIDYTVIITAFADPQALASQWKQVSAGLDRQQSAGVHGYATVLSRWLELAHVRKSTRIPGRWFSMVIPRRVRRTELANLEPDLQAFIWDFVGEDRINTDAGPDEPLLYPPTTLTDSPPGSPPHAVATADYQRELKQFGLIEVKYKCTLGAELRLSAVGI